MTGFAAVALVRAPVPLVVPLSVTAFGVLALLGPFWALPTAFLKEQAAAGGIALGVRRAERERRVG